MSSFRVSVGDQVFLDSSTEEIGAVRQVGEDFLVVYVENAGDFVVRGPHVASAHDGKVVLASKHAEPTLLAAAQQAHTRETE